jgi:hypothetical protein
MLLAELLLLESRTVKTLNGSTIKRSKYGVGKDIGGEVYLHRKYEDIIPDQEGLTKAKAVLAEKHPDFKYNTLKFSKAGFTFFASPDFDTVDEPTPGKYIRVLADGTAKAGETKSIWHHKWLWVKDDYTGFDVDEAYRRSKAWLTIPDIDFARIGSKAIWERDYVPRIPKY